MAYCCWAFNFREIANNIKILNKIFIGLQFIIMREIDSNTVVSQTFGNLESVLYSFLKGNI